MDVRLRKEVVTKQDKNGEVKKFVNYFLLTEDNNRIYIKPSFKDGYAQLSIAATLLPRATD